MNGIVGLLIIFSITALLINICDQSDGKNSKRRKHSIVFCTIITIVLVAVFVILNVFSIKRLKLQDNSTQSEILKKSDSKNNTVNVQGPGNSENKDNSDDGQESQDAQGEEIEGYKGITDATEKRVIKNTEDGEIGKCGVAIFDKDNITEEELAKFYNEKIKNKGYSFYTLIDKSDRTKGIVFSENSSEFTYGKLDKNYTVTKIYGHGEVENNKVKYEAR